MFTWKPVYTAIADKLVEFKDASERENLITVVSEVYSSVGNKELKVGLGDEKLTDIDPFTVFALVNRLDEENRTRVVAELLKKFGLSDQFHAPDDFSGVPTNYNGRPSFFGKGSDYNARIQDLWALFKAALGYSKAVNSETRADFITSYDAVWQSDGEQKDNITKGLFWIRPDTFLAFDEINRKFLKDPNNGSEEIARTVREIGRKTPTAETYLQLIDSVREILSEKGYASFADLSWRANGGMRDQYDKWLSDSKKSKIGEDAKRSYLSIGSVKKYIGRSPFEIVNSQEITNLIDQLSNNTEFNNGNSGTISNTYSYLKKYAEFLRGLEQTTASTPDGDTGGDNHPRNRIYFGAPGTGKSHQLKVAVEGEEKKDGTVIKDGDRGIFVTVKDGKVNERRYERVTFYPTYSYAQFVGCYKPVMEGEDIAYKFVPGPFLRVLVAALKDLKDLPTDPEDHSRDHCLVIEEINRANAAAVFGDVFQLLDRKDNGESEYDVAASEDVKKFLQDIFPAKDYSPPKEGDADEVKQRNPLSFLKVCFKKDEAGKETGDWKECRLRIPSNMYIWATMNSADQGVFPMDTAFKRRWEFEYIGIDSEETSCNDWTVEWKETGYPWNALRRIINALLSKHRVNEDKLMGAHFVHAEGKLVSAKAFKSKVLMYLWEDAARMCRRPMFGSIDTFSALLKKWDEIGVKVFESDDQLKNLKDDAETKDAYEALFKPAETQGGQPGSGPELDETGSVGVQ